MVFEQKTYEWRFYKAVPADVAGKVMEEIEQRDGELTKEAFLEASRPEDSPTHGLFEWDDTVAAERYRLQQSACCIRDITVTVVKSQEEPKTYSAYAKVTEGAKTKARYNNIFDAMEDNEKRRIVLDNAFTELQEFERKYQTYAELSGIFTEAHRAMRLHEQQKNLTA